MNNETLVLLEIAVGIQSTLGHLNLINNQGHHDGRGRWKKSILVKTGKLVVGRKNSQRYIAYDCQRIS